MYKKGKQKLTINPVNYILHVSPLGHIVGKIICLTILYHQKQSTANRKKNTSGQSFLPLCRDTSTFVALFMLVKSNQLKCSSHKFA